MYFYPFIVSLLLFYPDDLNVIYFFKTLNCRNSLTRELQKNHAVQCSSTVHRKKKKNIKYSSCVLNNILLNPQLLLHSSRVYLFVYTHFLLSFFLLLHGYFLHSLIIIVNTRLEFQSSTPIPASPNPTHPKTTTRRYGRNQSR